MQRLCVLTATCVLAISCSPDPPQPAVAEPGPTGNAPRDHDAGYDGNTAPDHRDAGVQELVVEVTSQVPAAPTAHARVYVDGARGTHVSGTTGEDGRVVLELEADSGPWDITAVKPGTPSLASVLNVTGQLERPLYLWIAAPRQPVTSAVQTIHGAVRGRASQPNVGPASIWLWGENIFDFVDEGSTYRASLYGGSTDSHVRALAIESETSGAGLLHNAVWIEFDRPFDQPSRDGLAVDIDFPNPPPPRHEIRMSLELPGAGAFQFAPALVADASREFDGGMVQAGNTRLAVGNSRLEPLAAPGRYAWVVEHLDVVRPDIAALERADPTGAAQLSVEHPASEGASITVPPVAALSAVGDTLHDLRLTWRADDYSSLQARLNSTYITPRALSWHVESYRGLSLTEHPWPALPSDANLDLNEFSADARVFVAAAIERDGSSISIAKGYPVSLRY